MEIYTERLLLHPFTIEDASAMYELCKDKDVGPMCGWSPHTSLEVTKEILTKFLMNDDTFGIYDKENKNLYGLISLNKASIRSDNEKAGMVGYWLGKEYWGNGYMPEALQAILTYGFYERGLEIIECGHFTTNTQSKRVIEKAGFVYEGTLRNSFFHRFYQKWIDECVYTIKKEEFEANNH